MSQGLELTLHVTEEEREDRWVAKCRAMGILVYGTTQGEAREALTGAVQALVDSYRMDGEDAVISWLNRKEVAYRLLEHGAPSKIQVIHEEATKSLTVEVGATA